MPAGNERVWCSGPKLQNRDRWCGKPSLTLDVQCISGGANGADHVGVIVAVERDTKPADMHVDGARLDIDILAPYRVEQLLAREDAAGMLHEVAQQAELGRAEMDRLAAADHAMGHEINDDVGIV